jgi:uncharacterized NAD(P)/FAD-binding protein YdhS
VHRHRLAPEVARRLEALLREGDLTICRGRLVGAALKETADGFPASAQWRPLGDTLVYRVGVHYVVNCMGPGGDPARSRSPLFQNLLATGLARPDCLRLGLDVDPAGRLIGRDGAVAAQLFAIGPPTRGIFWESTAVPDIRRHAAVVAGSALEVLARTSNRPARECALASVLT